MSDLKTLREKIDSIDDGILDLLVKRFKIIESVANFKKINNIEVVQNSRIDEIIKKVRNKASKNAINPLIFEKIYLNIIKLACDTEQKMIEKTE